MDIQQALPRISQFDLTRRRSSRRVNERLDHEMEHRLHALRTQGLHALRARRRELEREWDIDRALLVVFPVASGITNELAARVHPGFRRLLRMQFAFTLMHAFFGWCPPVPVLRRFGFRTRPEIEREKRAVEALILAAAH